MKSLCQTESESGQGIVVLILCCLTDLPLKTKSGCVTVTTEYVLQKSKVLTDVSKPQTNLDNNPCNKISMVF